MARLVSPVNGPRYAESAEDLQRGSAPPAGEEGANPNILFNGGFGVGFEELSKSVEQLVLWS